VGEKDLFIWYLLLLQLAIDTTHTATDMPRNRHDQVLSQQEHRPHHSRV